LFSGELRHQPDRFQSAQDAEYLVQRTFGHDGFATTRSDVSGMKAGDYADRFSKELWLLSA
jgi:hypothetical protein